MSDHEPLLAELKEALARGASRVASQLRIKHQPLYKRCLRAFGSWAGALAGVGLDFRAETGRFARGELEDSAIRRAAVRALVDRVGARPTAAQFKENGLLGLLAWHRGSVERALADAGFSDLAPQKQSPTKLAFTDAQTRIDALHALRPILGEDPASWKSRDVARHCPGLLNRFAAAAKSHSSSRLALALLEAGLISSATQLAVVPNGTWTRERRHAALRQAVATLGKPIREIKKSDLTALRLGGMLQVHYGNSIAKALLDAGVITWKGELGKTSAGFWGKLENRLRAVALVLERTGRAVVDVTVADFRRHGMGGLLDHLRKRGVAHPVYAAFASTGHDVSPDDFAHTPFGGQGKLHRPKCGCVVPSLFEKDIHDVVHARGWWHQHNVPYDDGETLTCDIVVPAGVDLREVWIEAAGMVGAGGSAGRAYQKRLDRKRKIARDQGLNLVVIKPDDAASAERLDELLSAIPPKSRLSAAARKKIEQVASRWKLLPVRRREGFWHPDRVLNLLRERAQSGKPMNSHAVERDEPVLWQYCRKFYRQYGSAYEAATGLPYADVAVRRRGPFWRRTRRQIAQGQSCR